MDPNIGQFISVNSPWAVVGILLWMLRENNKALADAAKEYGKMTTLLDTVCDTLPKISEAMATLLERLERRERGA